ncbi:MAG: hypothetical protein HYW88_00240 [Candidatus Sungbacteria bacterium]|nr:hypothetical protein [Candidatus Sungbacteria bacterium]
MAEINPTNEKSAEEEIKELERLLAEKKQAFEIAPQEKEGKVLFREVMKEYVPASEPAGESAPSAQFQPPVVSPPLPPADDEFKKKQREGQLQVLIDLSFEKGIIEAVRLAEVMTPWLLDELHDRLVDEYYEKLVQSERLKDL